MAQALSSIVDTCLISMPCSLERSSVVTFSRLAQYSPRTLLIWWRILLVVAACCVACRSTGNEERSSDEAANASNDARSIAVHEHGAYDSILRRLRSAALAGHPGSRELLGVLLLGGPAALQLSGASGQQTCEALGWFDLAADQGSEIGRAYRDLLSPAERSFARRHCLPLGD